MMTLMMGSPIMGRKKARSMPRPNRKVSPKASAKASRMGSSSQAAKAKTRKAPIASSWPWAKLITRLAL